MVRSLRKFTDLLMKVFGVVAAIALVLMTIVIFGQVLIRFTPVTNIAWTEELSRFAFIWSSMMGAAVAYNRGSFASITIVPNALKGKGRWVFDFVVEILVLAVCFIIIIYGFQLCTASAFMKTTALHAPMWVQYAPVPIGACGIALASITKIFEMFVKKETPADEAVSDTEKAGGEI